MSSQTLSPPFVGMESEGHLRPCLFEEMVIICSEFGASPISAREKYFLFKISRSFFPATFYCIYTQYAIRYLIEGHLLWQVGTGLSQMPGGLLPGAAHVTSDEPFKR